jgi:hypothetical protein
LRIGDPRIGEVGSLRILTPSEFGEAGSGAAFEMLFGDAGSGKFLEMLFGDAVFSLSSVLRIEKLLLLRRGCMSKSIAGITPSSLSRSNANKSLNECTVLNPPCLRGFRGRRCGDVGDIGTLSLPGFIRNCSKLVPARRGNCGIIIAFAFASLRFAPCSALPIMMRLKDLGED